MRLSVLVMLYLLHPCHLRAQFKLIDYSTPLNWPNITAEKISNDGKFLSYTITVGKSKPRVVVQAINSSWKKEMTGIVGDVRFSENSRWFLFKNAGDSMGILDLLKDSMQYIAAVGEFATAGGMDDQWIAYQIGKNKRELAVINLANNQEMRYSDVSNYFFSNNGRVLVIYINHIVDNMPEAALLWHNLLSGKDTSIYDGDDASDFVFDRTGEKFAFLATLGQKNGIGAVLRYYQSGMDRSCVIAGSPIPGNEGMVIMKEVPYFNNSGDKLFFRIIKAACKGSTIFLDAGPKVTIMNYKDDSLKLARERIHMSSENGYLSVVNLKGQKAIIIQLEASKDTDSYVMSKDGNYCIFSSPVNRPSGKRSNYYWRYTDIPDYYLVSTVDGSRRLLLKGQITTELYFSASGKYVIWFNSEQKNWFCYNVATSKTKNITYKIHTLITAGFPRPHFPGSFWSAGLIGWMENDKAVLVNDQRDIWEVDPEGEKPPVNLTHGYGYENNISLQYLNVKAGNQDPVTFSYNDTLLLTAFNFNNKENGFFTMPLTLHGKLQKLCMEPRQYYIDPREYEAFFCGASDEFFPLKAKCKNVYLVKRMSGTEYPNLYVTRDFREFQNFTKLAPQEKYNWYKPELIHWKSFDGSVAEGILYKPQDFDAKKKYPVIFYYYEQNSNGINVFIHPDLSNGQLNIPWFVSNGYIVAVPNIYYPIGDPGKGVYNSVVSCARYLSTMPWVDGHHLGLQGHSFGGWETNYLIAHSALFAAAASASGASDFIRIYEDYLPDEYYLVKGQGRIGQSLWQNVRKYIDNSPIFLANRVTTPVLIMHTKEDLSINKYVQGLQWYNALVRLGKKSWMLTYGGEEEHRLYETINQLDYSIRLAQFYDFYLKEKLPPKWMTQGTDINAENLYEIDSTYRRAP